MNSVLSVFVFIVVISYLVFWLMYKSLHSKKLELEQQVHGKAELVQYAVINEQKATERLTLVNQSKKQLLNRLNREIRTPLNGIIGMVSLLEETVLSDEQKEYNETIRNCSENLLTTINDIFLGDVLAQVNVESDKSSLELKNFDLRDSIEEVFDVFASQTALANVELVYQVDHRIPTLIKGDRLRMRQILMNLVENAVKFTSEGEIFINVHPKQQGENDFELWFEVHDTGLGMSAEKIKLLMTDVAMQEDLGDTQLPVDGLTICKQLIEWMGGHIQVESNKGKGTIVRFNIKTQIDEVAPDADHAMKALDEKRILIVEDNLTLQSALREEVMHWNMVPVLADSGAMALAILAQDTAIDLTLVQMQMPVMDGLMLSQSIHQQHPSLPIILLSIASDMESKKHPELFHSIITKPVRYLQLGQHILSALTHQQQDQGNLSTHKLSVDFAKRYPLKILIAEDNRINQKLAMRVLTKLGYDPDLVQNGKEVLEEVSKINYDLILMDVEMPEMDGLEATRMIRLCLPVQPVIMAMTANAMQGDREECLQAGMEDYISKPVHQEALIIKLEKWAMYVKEKQ